MMRHGWRRLAALRRQKNKGADDVGSSRLSSRPSRTAAAATGAPPPPPRVVRRRRWRRARSGRAPTAGRRRWLANEGGVAVAAPPPPTPARCFRRCRSSSDGAMCRSRPRAARMGGGGGQSSGGPWSASRCRWRAARRASTRCRRSRRPTRVAQAQPRPDGREARPSHREGDLHHLEHARGGQRGNLDSFADAVAEEGVESSAPAVRRRAGGGERRDDAAHGRAGGLARCAASAARRARTVARPSAASAAAAARRTRAEAATSARDNGAREERARCGRMSENGTRSTLQYQHFAPVPLPRPGGHTPGGHTRHANAGTQPARRGHTRRAARKVALQADDLAVVGAAVGVRAEPRIDALAVEDVAHGSRRQRSPCARDSRQIEHVCGASDMPGRSSGRHAKGGARCSSAEGGSVFGFTESVRRRSVS